MIADAYATEREFGIVWLADDGLREIGCAWRSSGCSSGSTTAG